MSNVNPHEIALSFDDNNHNNIVLDPIVISDKIYLDIDKQIFLPQSPNVLDNMAEIVVQYGYITLFFMVFPLMPLLAVLNNFFEQRVDLYSLIHSRRAVPFAAKGIGVWKNVLSMLV